MNPKSSNSLKSSGTRTRTTTWYWLLEHAAKAAAKNDNMFDFKSAYFLFD